jgi:hypothetical protein
VTQLTLGDLPTAKPCKGDPCTIEECEKPILGRGWCSMHYARWQKYGDPLHETRRYVKHGDKCNVEDCPEAGRTRGWCTGHYMRWLRHGDPEGGRYRYRLNEEFFDSIATEAKAYWLGFITADGCVRAGRAGANGWQVNQLYVKLKAPDAGHLEKLRADLAAEAPVLFVPQAGQAGPAAAIAFSSVHLTQSLIRLGVTPRKSLTATPWGGPAHLMRHYWRGMFDGDGTIVKHPDQRGKWHLRFLGSEACVEAFRAWGAPISGSAAKKYPKGNIWSWTAGGLASPQALVRELYGGATVYLDRKYELALQLMAAPIRHRSWLQPARLPLA